MKPWILYALASMGFAGATAVVAKLGLEGISGELGLAVRTAFVCVFVLAYAAASVPRSELQTLDWVNVKWLALSALTTAASWVFYYKAIKLGEVSTVAVIDNCSFLVAVVLAWLVLREPMSGRVAVGSLLVLVGLLIVSRR
jgi:bacterial/archaeal transporter family protein